MEPTPSTPEPRARLLCLQPFTQRRPARWECEGARCQRRPRSRLSVRQEEGMAGEARSRQSSSAASSRALPGAVTKARDCGGDCGEDGAGAACSCLGTQSVPLRFPPSARTPMGQPAPTARDQMGIPWHLRDDSPWASVGSKEAGAAQDNTQEAACSVPDTPEKRTTEARKVAVGGGGESLHIRKTVH